VSVACCELGAIPLINDITACRKEAGTPYDPARYSACMIGRGYQETSPGSFSKHTGIQPATIAKVAVVAGAIALAPHLVPAVIKGASSAVGAIKSAAESSAEPAGPSAPYVPALPIPAPAAPSSLASIVPGGISPGILILIGAGLLFALSRGR
jgi:hypothetical protein